MTKWSHLRRCCTCGKFRKFFELVTIDRKFNHRPIQVCKECYKKHYERDDAK